MEQTVSKNWLLAGLGIIVILGLKWVNTHWMLRTENFHSSNDSYEMSRAKDQGAEFDLSGRGIDREVLTDEEKKALVEQKKQAAANNTKSAIAGSKDRKDQTKKKKFSVNMMDSSREMGLSVSVNEGANSQTLNFESENLQTSQPQSKQKDNSKPTKGKSIEEWMALLSAHATSQLVAEFVAAHDAGDVTDADFYRISFALFNNQNAQSHQTGMDILTTDNSVNSFIYIAREYVKQSGGTQAGSSALWTLLLTYAQPTKFASLNQALRYSDQNVVAISLQILTIAVQEAQKQVSIAGNANQPQRTVAGTSAQTFKIFVSQLTSISQAGSSNASVAQSLLSQVQTIIKG